jgi:pimeloyl-ACP methyl ester carboxylesterase
MRPGLDNPGIKDDVRKVTLGMDKRYTLEAAEKLRDADIPILLVWARGDWLFPISGAERLASDARDARIVEIPDAKTFVPVDQPQRVAEEIAAFAPPA